jgi:hypothetical protein
MNRKYTREIFIICCFLLISKSTFAQEYINWYPWPTGCTSVTFDIYDLNAAFADRSLLK